MGVSDASIPSTAVRAAFQDTNCFPSDPNCFNGLTVNRGFDVQFTITDVSRTVPIEIFLGGYSSDGGVANFANTATLSLSLPDGISFTSDSGVFLSAAVTPPTTSAPEPSSLALMALGTLAVSAFRKRRNLASAAKHRE